MSFVIDINQDQFLKKLLKNLRQLQLLLIFGLLGADHVSN